MKTLLCIAASAALAQGAFAAPSIPRDDAQVLEQVPPRDDPAARAVRALEARLGAAPRDPVVAAEVARALLGRARLDGDPRWTGRAQSALLPWWNDVSPPEPIRVLRATVRQSLHDFPAALTDLDAAIKEAPRDPQAWLTRASVQQVRGDYHNARISCGPLVRLARPLIAAACLAGVNSLAGGLPSAEAYLRHILAQDDGREPGTRIWALTLLAEMNARRGDAAAAEQSYRDALAVEAPDAYLLASRADFLLDQGRPAEVVGLLRERTRADALLLRLALAEKALGKPNPAHLQMLGERFEASHVRGEVVHRREEARFRLALLGEAPQALQLALANWEVQREPADARVLLEAAVASRDAGAARPVLDFLEQAHLQDAALSRLRAELGR